MTPAGSPPGPEEQAFVRAAALFGVQVTPAHLHLYRRYYQEMMAWNRKVNLTAITEYGDVLFRHFLDSLSVAPLIPSPRSRLVDVGTGAGFPGLPLAITFPQLQVALVDSVGKKTAFLSHLTGALELAGVTVATARVEDLGRQPEHREQYDIAVCRAVDRLATLGEYLLPLCRSEGIAVAMKKGDIQEELDEAASIWTLFGGSLRSVETVPSVPGLQDGRVLVVIEKVGATPEAYPRRAGMPHKRPLRSPLP